MNSFDRRFQFAAAVVWLCIFATPAAAEVVRAVEYYHQAFEHYFVTANPAEIAALDSGAFSGWWRTGQRYQVDTASADGLVPVCRFYTSAYAGKASHFFTASESECAHVRNMPDWTYEGVAFYARLPDAQGNCRRGYCGDPSPVQQRPRRRAQSRLYRGRRQAEHTGRHRVGLRRGGVLRTFGRCRSNGSDTGLERVNVGTSGAGRIPFGHRRRQGANPIRTHNRHKHRSGRLLVWLLRARRPANTNPAHRPKPSRSWNAMSGDAAAAQQRGIRSQAHTSSSSVETWVER